MLAFVQQLCTAAKGDAFKGHGWNSNAGVIVRVLSNVFHRYHDRPEIQLLTFTTVLEIAGQSGTTKFVDTSLETVEKYAEVWKLDVEKKRDLLRTLHKALLADGRADTAFEVMTALLQTYTDDADVAKDDAREYVRTAIVDPKCFSFDHLLRSSAVRRLQQTDPKIYQVLDLFSTGQLVDYRKFIAENSNYVCDQLKVDEEVLEKKVKIMSLITLAEKEQVLRLDRLSADLDIPNGEQLEEFLIDAIRIKVVNGKINEQKGEFLVTYVQHRNFERPQWETLQKRLSALLRNVKNFHDNMDKIAAVGKD